MFSSSSSPSVPVTNNEMSTIILAMQKAGSSNADILAFVQNYKPTAPAASAGISMMPSYQQQLAAGLQQLEFAELRPQPRQRQYYQQQFAAATQPAQYQQQLQQQHQPAQYQQQQLQPAPRHQQFAAPPQLLQPAPRQKQQQQQQQQQLLQPADPRLQQLMPGDAICQKCPYGIVTKANFAAQDPNEPRRKRCNDCLAERKAMLQPKFKPAAASIALPPSGGGGSFDGVECRNFSVCNGHVPANVLARDAALNRRHPRTTCNPCNTAKAAEKAKAAAKAAAPRQPATAPHQLAAAAPHQLAAAAPQQPPQQLRASLQHQPAASFAAAATAAARASLQQQPAAAAAASTASAFQQLTPRPKAPLGAPPGLPRPSLIVPRSGSSSSSISKVLNFTEEVEEEASWITVGAAPAPKDEEDEEDEEEDEDEEDEEEDEEAEDEDEEAEATPTTCSVPGCGEDMDVDAPSGSMRCYACRHQDAAEISDCQWTKLPNGKRCRTAVITSVADKKLFLANKWEITCHRFCTEHAEAHRALKAAGGGGSRLVKHICEIPDCGRQFEISEHQLTKLQQKEGSTVCCPDCKEVGILSCQGLECKRPLFFTNLQKHWSVTHFAGKGQKWIPPKYCPACVEVATARRLR